MAVYAYVLVNCHLFVSSETMALVTVIFELNMQGMGKEPLLWFFNKPFIDMALEAGKNFDSILFHCHRFLDMERGFL
jgi:hypothetical protein